MTETVTELWRFVSQEWLDWFGILESKQPNESTGSSLIHITPDIFLSGWGWLYSSSRYPHASQDYDCFYLWWKHLRNQKCIWLVTDSCDSINVVEFSDGIWFLTVKNQKPESGFFCCCCSLTASSVSFCLFLSDPPDTVTICEILALNRRQACV